MSIKIDKINKTFNGFKALQNIDFEIKTGELIALLGPSGSGKTTLLRMIAGLDIPDTGAIYFEGKDIMTKAVQERKVGFVFQHYALFKHMSVFENIAFGLRVRPRRERPSEKVIQEKVASLLQLVQLDNLGDRYPSELSGGQRQRVALARALAIEPSVLLLDEPFGALDAKVRKELRQWLRDLHKNLHITSIFVTHDVEEALEVSDRIVVMNEGAVEQIGTPQEVYHHPANTFVYTFIGHVNMFQSQISDDKPRYIRPHQLEIHHTEIDVTCFEATISRIHEAGPLVKVVLNGMHGDVFQVDLSQDRYHKLGIKKDDRVFVRPKHELFFVEDYTI